MNHRQGVGKYIYSICGLNDGDGDGYYDDDDDDDDDGDDYYDYYSLVFEINILFLISTVNVWLQRCLRRPFPNCVP